MQMSRKLSVTLQLVGLHAVNNARDVRIRGRIELLPGSPVVFNRDPSLFQLDNLAVNVLAASGRWENGLLGHLATHCTCPIPDMFWGHFVSAIMDGDYSRLPQGLQVPEIRLVRFEGQTKSKTTHRPEGSDLTVFVVFEPGAEGLVDPVADYLDSAGMSVVRL
jgi:hypothetical protein